MTRCRRSIWASRLRVRDSSYGGGESPGELLGLFLCKSWLSCRRGRRRYESEYTGQVIILIMGVVGAGKTTVGKLLAGQLGWGFVDADSFHSPANIEKLKLGIPLDDTDRAPWLKAMREAINQWVAKRQNVVLACSALKRIYREELDGGVDVKLVYLKGRYEIIYRRLGLRQGHFASEKLLASQFAILEEPEEAVVVDVEQSPEDIVREIRRQMGLEPGQSEQLAFNS